MNPRESLARFEPLVLIAVGGFLGSLGRYGLASAVPGLLGTFLGNVTGSAALSVVVYSSVATDRVSRRTRLFVATGFLSSYTTYSTFALETTGVSPAVGLAYVVGSYACGFGAVVVGRRIVLEGRR